MPSKLLLPSASVLSSSPPRLCLPWEFTGCMITAALRTGLPLSSLIMRKFRVAVGSSASSFCATAVPRSAEADSRLASVQIFILLSMLTDFIYIDILASAADAGKLEVELCASLRCPVGSVFAICSPRLGGKLHQVAGDPGGVVAGDACFFEIISENRDHAQRFDGIEIGNDLASTLECVLGPEFLGNRSAIDQGVVEDLLASVGIESADVVGGGKAQTLICLGHQVADVNLGGRRLDDSIGDSMHQQVRDKTREQGTWTDADDVGAGDGFERLWLRIDIGWNEEQFLDASFAGGDLGFSADSGAIFHQRFKFDIRGRGRMNVATGDQNFRRQAHRFRKIMSDGGQRSQKKIAKAVTFETGAFVEAVTEELGEQSFILAESDDTVTDIAGRKHVEFFAQAAAGAAVVADRDHSAEIANDGRARLGCGHLCRSEGEAFESFEQGGEAGAAADCDNTETTLARRLFQG